MINKNLILTFLALGNISSYSFIVHDNGKHLRPERRPQMARKLTKLDYQVYAIIAGMVVGGILLLAWPIAVFAHLGYKLSVAILTLAAVIIIVILFIRKRRSTARLVPARSAPPPNTPPPSIPPVAVQPSNAVRPAVQEFPPFTSPTKAVNRSSGLGAASPPKDLALAQYQATQRLAAAQEAANRLEAERVERERQATEQLHAMNRDTTERWNEHPHWKYLAKRSHYILLSWIAYAGLVVAYLNYGRGYWQASVAMVVLLLLVIYYCIRRVIKWYGLRLIVRGYRLYVQECRSRLFLLFGQSQEVKASDIDAIAEEISKLETLLPLVFNCRTLKINTSIPEMPGEDPHRPNDKFRYLTDVKRAGELRTLLQQLGDEYLRSVPTAQRVH